MGTAEVVAHWHHSVGDFNTSSLEFYGAVETTLREKEAPSVKIERVNATEGGLFSAKREYLRVRFNRYTFDVCAAPFGKDFFFSWWLLQPGPGRIATVLMAIPFFGGAFARLMRPITYFSEDSRLIFEEAVHAVIVSQVDGLLKARGARALAPDEAKAQSRRLLPA